MTVETSLRVAEKPLEHLTINNASSAADVAWGSLFSTPLRQILSATAGVLQRAVDALEKGEAETEREGKMREQEREHVRQNAEAAILLLVV